jgi:hypothetical protein
MPGNSKGCRKHAARCAGSEPRLVDVTPPVGAWGDVIDGTHGRFRGVGWAVDFSWRLSAQQGRRAGRSPAHEISTVRSKDAVTLGDEPWTHLHLSDG